MTLTFYLMAFSAIVGIAAGAFYWQKQRRLQQALEGALSRLAELNQRLNDEADFRPKRSLGAASSFESDAGMPSDQMATKSDLAALEHEFDRRLKASEAAATKRLYSYLSTLNGVNSAFVNVHQRLLRQTAAKMLLRDLCQPLGLDHSERTLFYLAHKICLLDDKCLGRLGTSIDTIMLRALAAQAAINQQSKHLSVIEIGTLFGVAAGALHFAGRTAGADVHLTLIDPLFGYYGQGEPDIVTGVPVTRDILRENLHRMGIGENDVTLLQGLSEDPAIQDSVQDASIDLLIIDGDHTREGVARDFAGYLAKVRPGGYIVFDDYDVKEWPDVKAFVDEEIRPRTDLELVVTGWRSALVRKTSERSA